MHRSRVRTGVAGVLAALSLVPLVACGQDGSSAPPASAGPVAGASASAAGASTSAPAAAAKPYTAAFEKLERAFDARLGVYAIDTGTGREVVHNDRARFAYNSTFKALQAGVVLGKYSLDGLDQRVTYTRKDLVANSPVTEKHVDTGMTLKELCDASVRYSDNTAANLLFDHVGGPRGLDASLEKLGDDVTRMDRVEPELSRWVPGEKRDTSTPRALAGDLRAFVLDGALPAPEREQLTTWLRTNTTGDAVIRRGCQRTGSSATRPERAATTGPQRHRRGVAPGLLPHRDRHPLEPRHERRRAVRRADRRGGLRGRRLAVLLRPVRVGRAGRPRSPPEARTRSGQPVRAGGRGRAAGLRPPCSAAAGRRRPVRNSYACAVTQEPGRTGPSEPLTTDAVTRIVLRPIASPLPLGFFALGMGARSSPPSSSAGCRPRRAASCCCSFSSSSCRSNSSAGSSPSSPATRGRAPRCCCSAPPGPGRA